LEKEKAMLHSESQVKLNDLLGDLETTKRKNSLLCEDLKKLENLVHELEMLRRTGTTGGDKRQVNKQPQAKPAVNISKPRMPDLRSVKPKVGCCVPTWV
jgi:hypothetical protein